MAEDEKAAKESSFALFGRRIPIPVALAGAALTFFGGVYASWVTLATKDHELRIRLVEIGIGILRADPKENVSPARGWAIRLIEHNSGESFAPEEVEALKGNALKITAYDGYFDGNAYPQPLDQRLETSPPHGENGPRSLPKK